MNRLCDTNMMYGLAFGEIDIKKLRDGAEKLLLSPVSVLEIISKIDKSNFTVRKKVAEAALKYVDEFTVDPETHLARIWFINVPHEPLDWSQALRAVSQAPSVSALTQGVADWKARVVRKVNIALSDTWRMYHYQDFVKKMIDAVEAYRPGYKADKSAGRITMSEEKKTEWRKQFEQNSTLRSIIDATRDRVAPSGNAAAPQPPTSEQIKSAEKHLRSYALVYQKYFEVCSTESVPRENDWGDLECFIYVDDSTMVATNEGKWIKIAQAVGLGESIFTTNPKYLTCQQGG